MRENFKTNLGRQPYRENNEGRQPYRKKNKSVRQSCRENPKANQMRQLWRENKEALGSDLTIRFCRLASFQELAIPGDREKAIMKNKKVMGVGFNHQKGIIRRSQGLSFSRNEISIIRARFE
jgi:hypothetical protein